MALAGDGERNRRLVHATVGVDSVRRPEDHLAIEVETKSGIRLSGTSNRETAPLFSLDGQGIGFFADSKMKKISVGAARRLRRATLPLV